MTLVAGVCACALGALATPALAASPIYYGTFTSSADGAAVASYDSVHTASSDTHDLKLMRDGAVVAESTDPYPFISLPAGGLHAGDQAVLFANGAQVATFGYDGTPTINPDACAGAGQFTGAAGAGDLYVSAFTPANGSGTQHNIAVSRTSNGYTAALDTPLISGDRVTVDLLNTIGDVHTDSYTRSLVAACPSSTPPSDGTTTPSTPVVIPTGPTTTQLLAGVTTSLTKETKLLSSLGIEKVVSSGGVNVPFVFLSAGTIGYVWLANAPAHAATAAKTVTVAKGSLTRSAPGSAKVKVRLTKAGKKLLRRSRSLKLTIRGTFTPVGGKPQVATKKVTVKRHATKKHG
jgi:hypothetical protein